MLFILFYFSLVGVYRYSHNNIEWTFYRKNCQCNCSECFLHSNLFRRFKYSWFKTPGLVAVQGFRSIAQPVLFITITQLMYNTLSNLCYCLISLADPELQRRGGQISPQNVHLSPKISDDLFFSHQLSFPRFNMVFLPKFFFDLFHIVFFRKGGQITSRHR